MDAPRFGRYELYAIVAVLFLLSTAVIYIRTATVKATYHYVQQEKELIKLQQDIQAVRVRWLKLTSPRRLEAIAHSIGLFPPEIHQVLRLKTDRVAQK